MTPTEFRATLATLGWSLGALARQLGRKEATVKNWVRPGYSVPQEVADWLRRRAVAHAADPAPR